MYYNGGSNLLEYSSEFFNFSLKVNSNYVDIVLFCVYFKMAYKKNFKTKNSPGPQRNKFKEKGQFKFKKKNRQVEQSKTSDQPEEDIELVPEQFVPSFNPPASPENSDGELDMHKLLLEQNRKKKKSGGFQSMGLSYPVFKGIMSKGYKVPTPIQRKCIPLIIEGKDLVAMARTGSGKTAAFLVPMFEKLKSHVTQEGVRALILSPTRELALQTFQFTKELGKFTGLKSTVILGGDRMEDQFSAIHENPDIIIASPGRLLHVVMEMELKLNSVEYVVFDEADRLFEMGFQEQLHGLLKQLPDSRQTLLFSATLPGILVDFAKAGLHDPTLIRLDVDTKLSENLQLAFFCCRFVDKPAILLYLLKNVIYGDEQTVVFVATKHDVEYLKELLTVADLTCSYIYSSLDPTERKIQIARFKNRMAPVMIVTDIAARGIDIPMLDNVINYNFPGKSKLFIHRVGRVARAGRTGTSYSLVSSDEMPYVLDLHLTLGRPLKYAGACGSDDNGICGSVPQTFIDEEDELIKMLHAKATELISLENVCRNGYKHYLKSRPVPSSESVKRFKEEQIDQIEPHPLFEKLKSSLESHRYNLLKEIKNYKPHSTIFEVGPTAKSQAVTVMKMKRAKHTKTIQRHQLKLQEKKIATNLQQQYLIGASNPKHTLATSENIQNTFVSIIHPKTHSNNRSFKEKKKKKEGQDVRDKDYYIPYRASNFYSEKGLEVEKSSFVEQASSAVLDLTGDDEKRNMNFKNKQLKWDRKKKKFVHDTSKDSSSKRIKTESGAWIAASYKKDIYKRWLGRNQVDKDDSGSDEPQRQTKAFFPGSRNKKTKERIRHELKTKEEIIKKRKWKAKVQYKQKQRQVMKAKKKSVGKRKK